MIKQLTNSVIAKYRQVIDLPAIDNLVQYLFIVCMETSLLLRKNIYKYLPKRHISCYFSSIISSLIVNFFSHLLD